VCQKRIVTDIDRIPRKVAGSKTVLLDDLSKSGTQLGNAFGRVMEAGNSDKRDIEVHLVIASGKQIENPSIQGRPLRTYAYFHGGKDTGKGLTCGPLATSSRSSTDFDFDIPIARIVQALNDLHPDSPVAMPPPTNIARTGRY
jgi:hypothetical protein